MTVQAQDFLSGITSHPDAEQGRQQGQPRRFRVLLDNPTLLDLEDVKGAKEQRGRERESNCGGQEVCGDRSGPGRSASKHEERDTKRGRAER
ncbi:hypothetical protein [Beijerinckia sp. L45]|uniref:hypothetical protein n=1 Tax=Beijerinckia sp. L45 TaxID=1641855 RepID=UPI00131DEA0F|nr:hypothetical protein [Beijerinckia sp. L45]